LAVFLALRKSEAFGAPLEPGLRIFSLDPALILLRFAWMLAYSPRLLGTFLPFFLWWSSSFVSVCTFSAGHYFLLDLAPEHFQRFLDKLLGVLGSFCLDFGRRFLIPNERAQ
jgi:hypothetical protein